MEELEKLEEDRRNGRLPGPGIAATAVSTLAAVIYCKMMDGERRT